MSAAKARFRDAGASRGCVTPRSGVTSASFGYLAYADTATPYAYAKEFLTFDQRPAAGDRDTISRDITALRAKVDILVVSMHWGIEYISEPDPMQVELGRFIIDSGADIVAGHHPHVQQDAEVYKSGLIIYSMGNYVFDQHSRPLTRESRIYRVTVDKKGVRRAEFVPCEIPSGLWQPRPKSDSPVLVWDRDAMKKSGDCASRRKTSRGLAHAGFTLPARSDLSIPHAAG